MDFTAGIAAELLEGKHVSYFESNRSLCEETSTHCIKINNRKPMSSLGVKLNATFPAHVDRLWTADADDFCITFIRCQRRDYINDLHRFNARLPSVDDTGACY